MAERDPSERDLAAAFRAYLEGAPTEVRPAELARHFATVYPQGRTSIGPWRFAAIPRPVLALLLGAALLAALVGGALLVGSQLERRLPAVVPPVGQVFECPPGSNPDKPGPVDQARPTKSSDEWPSLAFDRRAGKLVRAGRGDFAETWTFDVCTNTWTQMHPDREPPGILPGWLVYDVDSDLTIGVQDGPNGVPRTVWAYDLQANTWTEKGPSPPVLDSFYGLPFYDPVSGHVVAPGGGRGGDTLGPELWSYEVEADRWTRIPKTEPLVIGPHYEFFAYDASVDRLVAYANAWKDAGDAGNFDWIFEATTWLFDLRTGTWAGASAVTPPGFTAGVYGQIPAIAYDEASRRTVLLGQGHSAAYDATANRWETLYEGSTAEDWWVACGTRPECRQMPFMVYDPVNERLVVYGGSILTDSDWGSRWVSPDDVQAFDTRTREWTVLLEASQAVAPEVLPSPGK